MAFWNQWRRDRAKFAGMLFELQSRLDRLESQAACALSARGKESRSAKDEGSVKAWLPVLARMQEVTLAAMGHPDMAREFGLVDRQREATPEPEGPDEWADQGSKDPEEDDGMIYG